MFFRLDDIECCKVADLKISLFAVSRNSNALLNKSELFNPSEI